MERSVTTGMQPEDFFGRCPTCSVECQDDILKLISKFCQGIVIEEAVPSSDCPSSIAFATESRGGWPSFDVTGGSDDDSILQITTKRETTPGDIRFGSSLPCYNDGGKWCDTYNTLYKQIGDFNGPGHGCGPAQYANRMILHPSSREPGRYLSTEYTGQWSHIEDPERWSNRNTDHTDDWATGRESWTENVSEEVSGCPEFAFISSMTTIETVDLYTKEERFVIFPVCGELRVEDSGDDYISLTSESPGSFGTTITDDIEAVFILISSDCPDPHIAKSSEHPHMVGRTTAKATFSDFGSATGYRKNPAYSDEREFDNVEQKRNLGMYKLTYATKIGSVYKTTIGGAHDGDHVYYTSVDPRLYQENLGATDIEITQNDLCPDPEYWQFPRDSQCCGRNNILTLPMKKYDLPDEYQYHREAGNDPNPVTVTLKEFSIYDEFYDEYIEYWAWEWHDDNQRPITELCEFDGECPPYMAQAHINKLYYCAYKPGDLADFTDGQKEYIYDSMEDVIAAKELEVGRRKIVAENNKFYMSPDNALGGIGCSKSGFMAVASSTEAHLDKDWGMQYWDPSLEDGPAFSIDGSNLYNRDRTEAISLQDEVLRPVTPYGYRQITGPLVGVTFYQAEISYRDFAKKAELETDYELDFDKIYERSFSFSNTVIPDGYGTGGYGKKENLDTPEKAIMAFTEVMPDYGYGYGPPRYAGASLDRAGTYYRWTQDKYYYDLKQLEGRQYFNQGHQTFNFLGGRGKVVFKDSPERQCRCDEHCLSFGGGRARSGCDFNRQDIVFELGDLTTPRWFTGGGSADGVEYAAIGRESCYSSLGFYTKHASYPPKFDEGQRVHDDGSIDMDDFSFATTQRKVYIEDPDNPDEQITTPWGFSYWKRNGKTEERDFLVDGALCLGDDEEKYSGSLQFPAGGGGRMEEEDMTGVPKLDPDYNYFVHRPRIYRRFFRGDAFDNTIPDRDYDFHLCGEKFIGFGKKYPVRGYGYLESPFDPGYDPITGEQFGVRTLLYACVLCMTARIEKDNPDRCWHVQQVWNPDLNGGMGGYEPGDIVICDHIWCKDGHSIPGEIHSPREKGFVWYSIEGQGATWISNCCGGEPELVAEHEGLGNELADADWEEKTNSIMGCRLIKIPKISSGVTSSVGLGELSIKVSLK